MQETEYSKCIEKF